MRMLMVTPYVPLATKPRPYRLLRYLARHHEVHLLAFDVAPDRSYAKRPDFQELQRACASMTLIGLPQLQRYRNVALSLLSSLPARAAYYTGPAGRRVREEIARQVETKGIDVIHVDRLRLAHLCSQAPLPKVVDATDCISEYLRQCVRYVPRHLKAAYALEAAKTARFERHAAAAYERCLVTTQHERMLYAPSSYFDRVGVVPNLLDREFFARPLRSERSVDAPTLLYLGNLGYLPNADAAQVLLRQIWPRVRAKFPAARLILGGSDPPEALRQAAQAAGAEVTGFIPNLGDLMQSATLLISPVRIAVGFPNKVAEALALGTPVVSTSAGCRGLEQSESVVEVADEPQAFAEAVVRLVKDHAARGRLAREGREYARTYLHPDRTEAEIDIIFAEVTRQSGKGMSPEADMVPLRGGRWHD